MANVLPSSGVGVAPRIPPVTHSHACGIGVEERIPMRVEVSMQARRRVGYASKGVLCEESPHLGVEVPSLGINEPGLNVELVPRERERPERQANFTSDFTPRVKAAAQR